MLRTFLRTILIEGIKNSFLIRLKNCIGFRIPDASLERTSYKSMVFFCKKNPAVIQTAGLKNIVLRYPVKPLQRAFLYQVSSLVLLRQQHLFHC